MSGFWAALRFLTITPVPFDWGVSPEALARAKPWFPAVGLLIGAAAAGLLSLLDRIFPSTIASVLLVGFLISVSRGLHADGLADTADGFFSSRSRDRILEIMRDSRIGTMGVLALVFTIILRIVCLDTLPTDTRLEAVVIAPLAGRCAMIQMIGSLSYVRKSGLGTIFYERSTRLAVVVSLGILLSTGWLLLGVHGLITGVGVCILTHLLVIKCRRVIGGATGDTLGTACELLEVAVLVILVILPGNL